MLIPPELFLRRYGHETYFVLAKEEQRKLRADVLINFALCHHIGRTDG
jgi:hypothetical protein